jgi:hypothetical protein
MFYNHLTGRLLYQSCHELNVAERFKRTEINFSLFYERRDY